MGRPNSLEKTLMLGKWKEKDKVDGLDDNGNECTIRKRLGVDYHSEKLSV